MQNHNFQTCAYHTGQGAIFQNFYSYKINAGAIIYAYYWAPTIRDKMYEYHYSGRDGNISSFFLYSYMYEAIDAYYWASARDSQYHARNYDSNDGYINSTGIYFGLKSEAMHFVGSLHTMVVEACEQC